MSPEVVFSSVLFLTLFTGLLLNGFIVSVNLFWWMKYRTRETVDLLLTSLGLLRLILIALYKGEISLILSGASWVQIYNKYLEAVILCLIFCSLWWGSVLCVFYCVKITDYSNRIFIRIKMNISKMVPWMLLISLIISCLTSLPYKWLFVSLHFSNVTVSGNAVTGVNLSKIFVIICAGSIVPFMIFCVAISVIIVSLLRHTRNISGRDSGFSDAQRDVHLSVTRNMIGFLLFYFLCFVAHMVMPLLEVNSTWSLGCLLLIYVCPSLHSILFIVSNKKLKKTFLSVLRCPLFKS